MIKYEFDGDNIIIEYNGKKITSIFTRQIFKEIHNDLENMINCSIHDEVIDFVNTIIYLNINGLDWSYEMKINNILSDEEKGVIRKLVDELERDIKKITIESLVKKVILPQAMLVELASLEEKELLLTHHTLGRYIRNEYKLWNLEVYDQQGFIMHPDEVSSTIIKAIWNTL